MKNIFNQIPYVCRIYCPESETYGHGVFVSPRHIVTAWHVVMDVREHIGVNSMSNLHPYDEMGYIFQRGGLGSDMALVRLSSPLSKSFRNVATEFDPYDTLTLASKDLPFLRKTIRGSMHIPTGNPDCLKGDFWKSVPFLWPKETRYGMSGSPVLDSKGDVVSVLSYADTPHAGATFHQNAAGEWIQEIKGPNPIHLMNFIDPYRDEIAEACEMGLR